jgi:hypothetical protein
VIDELELPMRSEVILKSDSVFDSKMGIFPAPGHGRNYQWFVGFSPMMAWVAYWSQSGMIIFLDVAHSHPHSRS